MTVISISGTGGLLAIGMAFEPVLVEIGLSAIGVVVAEIAAIGVVVAKIVAIGVVGRQKCLSSTSIISRVLMHSCSCWKTSAGSGVSESIRRQFSITTNGLLSVTPDGLLVVRILSLPFSILERGIL